jgi:UPF0176 protein
MSQPPLYRVTQFYRFVSLPDPTTVAREHRALCQRLGLLGRVYIAAEGLNSTVAGTPEALQVYIDTLEADDRFRGILYKTHDCNRLPFRKLSVQVKSEIVALKTDKPHDPLERTGAYVSPTEMQQLLREQPNEVVIFDARSRYESELGRFRGALSLPDLENFRDLPERLQELAPFKDKTIVTYCTGGVKCEKLTALMLNEGFRDVRQLHGGILHYAEVTGGEHFEGTCYVFDDRVSVPVNTVNPTTIGQCVACGNPADFPANCANVQCHKRVVLCHSCANQLEGCCSTHCHTHGERRAWNKLGRFVRGDKPVAREAVAG